MGSFKLRGVTNAVLQVPKAELADGVWTVSAGNTAQALAWTARELGVPMTAVVPENAPETKLANIERLGGSYHQGAVRGLRPCICHALVPGGERPLHPSHSATLRSWRATRPLVSRSWRTCPMWTRLWLRTGAEAYAVGLPPPSGPPSPTPRCTLRRLRPLRRWRPHSTRESRRGSTTLSASWMP